MNYQIIICLLLFSFPIFIDVYGQQGSRDLMAEYCQNNWIKDPVRCADYVPPDYEANNAKYQAQEAEKEKQGITQSNSAKESQRICPLGSHLDVDSFGNQVCVDSKTNEVVANPNTSQSDFGDNGTVIGIAVFIIIILIIAVIVKSRGKSKEPESLPRRGWSPSENKLILAKQNGKCAWCGEYSGSYHFDHKDDNHYNNDLDNAQALCPNCHDRKSRGLD